MAPAPHPADAFAGLRVRCWFLDGAATAWWSWEQRGSEGGSAVGSGGADHVAQRGELRTAAGDRLVARIDGATDKWVTRMPRVDPDAGLGSGVPTLRDRLPVDLREAACGPDFEALPFTPLYLLDDEWATEIANRTTHGVMHPGWAPDGTGATAASWPSS